jgi:hypothetical protein
MEKFEKFIPRENLEPTCEVCGGAHKTSRHDESLLGKTELMNPVCEICKGRHKTSQHDEYAKERMLNPTDFDKSDKYEKKNEEPRCEVCGGAHKTSLHDDISDLERRQEPKQK